ncbi:MAG: hypothetical protein Q9221_002518 [Calogaya cf. arnoldii]
MTTTPTHSAINDIKKRSHSLAFFTTLASSLCLSILLALGVFANVNKFIVGTDSTQGCKAINLDTVSWNVACTVVGTAVGILAAVAFSNQDDVLTCLVALFGIHASQEEVINPSSSVSLAALNQTFFATSRKGELFAAGPPTSSVVSGQLSGFLYKAAYIAGREMLKDNDPHDPYTTYLPKTGPLGDTIYRRLNTRGVGLNVSSYLQYSGITDGFNIPARFEFNELNAIVYATQVNLSCQNATSEYTISSVDIGELTLIYVSKPNGPNITLVRNLEANFFLTTLAIGSAITIDLETDNPIHALVIPEFITESALVLECTYSGREYLTNISVSSPTSPLLIGDTAYEGSLIGPIVKQNIANITHRLLSAGAQGGNLARGFIDAKYNYDGLNNTGIASALEGVIGQVGEAYFSILRQPFERSNIYNANQDSEAVSELRLHVTISRMGGAQYGWLAVLGILLIPSLVGTFRTCMRRKAVGFEAQDTVTLLSRLFDEPIRDAIRIRYDDKFTVVPGNQPKPAKEQEAG